MAKLVVYDRILMTVSSNNIFFKKEFLWKHDISLSVLVLKISNKLTMEP